jgi:regulatory protein
MRNSELTDKTLTRAKNTAYRFLSYRPRSRAEIETKLRDKEFDEATVAAVLVDLARLGFVNDEQFARAWARGRIRLRGFGRRRIDQELRSKGVAPEIIRESLAEIFGETSETETAMHVAEKKKLRTMRHVEPEARKRRLAGLLERKGYAFDVIREVLSAVRAVKSIF